MGRKIPVFVKGGAPKNNTDTSHGISVFSYGIYPTEFYGIDCLIPLQCFLNTCTVTDAYREGGKTFHQIVPQMENGSVPSILRPV